MKKIFFILSFIFFSTTVFAENVKYSEYFSKARNFESNKMWVSALGSYWDAMEAEPTIKAKEAYLAYQKIADEIKKGNPGIGNYDEFEFHDEWKKLQEDYEKYWSKNSARYFEFSKVNRKSRNFDTRTVNYSVKLHSSLSSKFLEITKLVRAGYEKAWQDDWEMYSGWLSMNNQEKNNKLAIQLLTKPFQEKQNHKTQYSYTLQQLVFDESLYSINFEINDSEGTTILSGSCKSGMSCDFPKIEQLKSKILDSQKIKITPKSISIPGLRNFSHENINVITPYDSKYSSDKNVLEELKILF
ncbi:MAG: hypothetical protein KBT11_00910 [Treponema sp.]|nr:hypothetical protein [Candidatus Treponema equifaecale]